jgi:hypothetical protein
MCSSVSGKARRPYWIMSTTFSSSKHQNFYVLWTSLSSMRSDAVAPFRSTPSHTDHADICVEGSSNLKEFHCYPWVTLIQIHRCLITTSAHYPWAMIDSYSSLDINPDRPCHQLKLSTRQHCFSTPTHMSDHMSNRQCHIMSMCPILTACLTAIIISNICNLGQDLPAGCSGEDKRPLLCQRWAALSGGSLVLRLHVASSTARRGKYLARSKPLALDDEHGDTRRWGFLPGSMVMGLIVLSLPQYWGKH